MDDAGGIRRGLEAATVGLVAMAEMMDRVSAMLVLWDARSVGGTNPLGDHRRLAWAQAARELREVIAPSQPAISQAVELAPGRGCGG
jgi:hypothetical protein